MKNLAHTWFKKAYMDTLGNRLSLDLQDKFEIRKKFQGFHYNNMTPRTILTYDIRI